MKRISIALILLVLVSSFATKKTQTWFAGVWEGQGTQPSANYETWTIKAVLDPANNVYTIDYPSLNCGGKWTLTTCSKKSAEFHEYIESGKDKCVPDGKVVLTKLDEEHIRYEYYLNNAYYRDSYGDLTKQK